MTYAHAVQAAVAVWAVAAAEPPFLREHLDALAGLNKVFAASAGSPRLPSRWSQSPARSPRPPGHPSFPG